MKKSIIALTVTAVLAAPLAAQAEVKVYGKVHINAGTYKETLAGVTQEDNFQINSYASRFGVKGSHKLDGDLEATYKLEWEVNPDQDGVKNLVINNRNQYVGLKGGFGEVRIGTHDTPLKMVQGKFDQFGDTLADLKNAGSDDGEHRFENVIAYLGKSGSMSYAIAAIPSEGDGTTAGDGVADSISASIAYKEGPLYIGVAADSYDDTGAAAGTSNSLTRLVATYKFDGSQLGLLWQSGVEKVSVSSSEEDWLGISFKTRMGGKNTFKAQYIMVEDNQSTATENTLTGIGIEHKFGKKTKGYLLFTDFESDAAGSANDEEISSVSLGYVIKF